MNKMVSINWCNLFHTTLKIFKAPRLTAQKNTSIQEKKKIAGVQNIIITY